MHTIIRKKSGGLRKEAIEFAQKLVRTPSASFEEGEIADLVENEMRRLKFDKVMRDEFGNVIGVMLGREISPTLLLNCHMDTVPVEDEDKWSYSPYSGEIKGDRLLGRGASDCKGGLAAQIYSASLLKRSLLPLKGNIVVAATVAEEAGDSAGVRGLIEQTLPELELRPTSAILGEPTDLGLYYGHDGWLEIEVRVEGANPFQVDDAAKAVFEYLGHNRSKNAGKYTGESGGRESVTLDAPRFEESGGIRRATILVARRMHESEEASSLIEHVREGASMAAGGAGSVAVNVTLRKENFKHYTGRPVAIERIVNAWEIDPFHRLMERARQSLEAAGCEIRPGKWELGRLGMGTAGGALVNDFGIPTLGYGPGNENEAHATDESIEIEKIHEAMIGTAVIAHGLVGIPVYGWTSDEI